MTFLKPSEKEGFYFPVMLDVSPLVSPAKKVYTFKYIPEDGVQVAKLFQNGQSQAVRLPKEFRFQGSEVYIKKSHNSVVLIPKDNPWESLLRGLEGFTDDFMSDRNQPGNQDRESL